jgi:hypothetical protein
MSTVYPGRCRLMTTSDDRWVHPADGEDPRAIDRENTDAEAMAEREKTRTVTRDQEVERDHGLSSDKPGVDPSDRDRDGEGGVPTAD